MLDGLSSHAIPSVQGLGQALVAVHVAAMGLWAGGLVGYLRAPDPRFGRYAAAAFGVAVASGAVLGFVHTDFGAALFASAYGRVLLLKIAIVGCAIVAAAVRRRRAEAWLALAVAGSAALLAALPPPL
jgi:putative copper export protein